MAARQPDADWLNRNTRDQAEKNIHAHYDLSNVFYGAWLDPTMSYSSGYHAGADGLEAAQRRKWQRLAEQLGQDDRGPATLLEIGCGWGAMAGHFAAGGSESHLDQPVRRATGLGARALPRS